MNQDDLTYKKALQYTTHFQEPVGFSQHIAASQTDKIVIRQNNIIRKIVKRKRNRKVSSYKYRRIN